MKILYYNLLLGSHDGSSMHAKGLLDALKRTIGDDCVMVANKYENKHYEHNKSQIKKNFSKALRYFRIARRKYFSKKNAIEIVEQAKRNNFHPDFILARSVLYDTTPIKVAKLLGCKLIIEHNTPLYYEACELQNLESPINVKKFEKEILEVADFIYVISDTLKEMLLKKYPDLQCDKLISIPNGYMKDLYIHTNSNKSKTRKELRQIYNTSDKKVIIFIGSLKKWHGIDKLLLTANHLKNNHNIEFWIIGDGEERDLVKKYLEKSDNLRWFGSVPMRELRDLLWSSDLGIMPYNTIENFYFSPLKMFDMIGAKLPFIGVDIGQIGEIVRNHLSDDFLVRNNDPKVLSYTIMKILSNEMIYSGMKKKIGEMNGQYTWDFVATKLISFVSNSTL